LASPSSVAAILKNRRERAPAGPPQPPLLAGLAGRPVLLVYKNGERQFCPRAARVAVWLKHLENRSRQQADPLETVPVLAMGRSPPPTLPTK